MRREKQRVLVVDDNPANRLAFQTVLEKDYDVRLAESGSQAIELARREEFAVILLDVRMPEMDGFETGTRLRRLGSTTYTSIIFTSAMDKTQEHVNQGFIVGATDYLFCPVEPEFLKFKVATYAQIYVRNQALLLQIAYLNEVVRSLRAEAKSAEGSSETWIRRLQEVVEELKRQIQGSVSAS